MATVPTDLHQRLLAGLDLTSPLRVALTGDVYRALRAVVELHAPVTHYPGSDVSVGFRPQCFGCEIDGYDAEHPEWPCGTVKAIARELGIEVAP
jgi:hypothetical protein